MADNKFEFRIRSRKGDGDLLRLDDFAIELSHFYKVLSKLDRLVSRRRQPTMFFEITSLKYCSPALVEVLAVPEAPTVDYTEDVGKKFIAGMGDIKRGEIPADFDAPLVQEFRQIGSTLKRNVASIDVAYGGESVVLDRHLEEFVAEVLGGDYFAEGSITGMLEQINVHEGKNEFRIYPVAGPVSIKCKFADDIKDRAVKALDKHITISGRFSYRPREKFPYFAEVNSIEIHPPDKKLPSFADLQGIAPNATEGLSSEGFIGEIRSVD
jgi:hypothetical protein